MEIFQESTFTAFLALVLSFLLAKIVSFAVSNSRIESNTAVSSVNEGGVQKGVIVDSRLKVRGGKGKKKVKFVDDFVIKRVDRYEDSEKMVFLDDVEGQSVDEKVRERVDQEDGVNEDARGKMIEQQCLDAQNKGSKKDHMVIEEKCDDDKMEGCFGVNEKISETSGVKSVILENQKSEVQFEGDALETSGLRSAILEDQKNEVEFEGDAMDTSGLKTAILENQKNEVEFEGDGLRTSALKSAILENEKNEVEFQGDDTVIEQKEVNGEEGIVENEGKNEEEVEEEGRVGIESDDDWEGIERSELEKVFAGAVNYVECGGKGKERDDDRLAKLGSDVQMELYGLHKVAVEGPCHEPQPMAFKMSARAKWNAWQRLGSMSPEMAMERYIRVLSDNIPRWMHDSSADVDVQGSPKSEVVGETSVPKLERLSELSATPTNDSSTRQSSVDSVQKDDDIV